MSSSVTAQVLTQTFKTLSVNKETLIAIINNTEDVNKAANIVGTMVTGFYSDDVKNMLSEVKQGLDLVNSKFPIMTVETTRYCGDMEILESKEIDFVNDSVVTRSHNSVIESEMTEKDFDYYTKWLNELKRVLK